MSKHKRIPEGYPDEFGSLILEFQGTELLLPFGRFKSQPRKRSSDMAVTIEYSFLGNPIIKSRSADVKYVWDINTYCDRDQTLLLESMIQDQYDFIKDNYNAKNEDYAMILHDYTQPITENTDIKRAFARGVSSNVDIKENSCDKNAATTKYSAYFAKFYCVGDPSNLTCTPSGKNFFEVNFQLRETAKFTR